MQIEAKQSSRCINLEKISVIFSPQGSRFNLVFWLHHFCIFESELLAYKRVMCHDETAIQTSTLLKYGHYKIRSNVYFSGNGKSWASERHWCQSPPCSPASSGTGEKVQLALCIIYQVSHFIVVALCGWWRGPARASFVMNDLELSVWSSFIMLLGRKDGSHS